MKKVTASDARKRWFRLLDDAASGEVIVVERKGQRLVLRREEPKKSGKTGATPAYRRLLRASSADEADRWSWEWRRRGGLVPRRAPAR
jgi:antitoxin (DNA-binding transcriptional repressor) of toxin-antitoxin stability system